MEVSMKIMNQFGELINRIARTLAIMKNDAVDREDVKTLGCIDDLIKDLTSLFDKMDNEKSASNQTLLFNLGIIQFNLLAASRFNRDDHQGTGLSALEVLYGALGFDTHMNLLNQAHQKLKRRQLSKKNG